MPVTQTEEKVIKIETSILQVQISEKNYHQRGRHVIGYFISSLTAVRYGTLYYRALEKNKVEVLKISKKIILKQKCRSRQKPDVN